MRRWVRRCLVGAVVGVVVVPVGGIAVLAVEVQLAKGGPDLADRVPYDLDGRVDPPAGTTVTGPVLSMAWLGDSTAAGVGASGPDAALPRLVATRVAADLGRPVDLVSFAVSGNRVGDVLVDQVGRVPALVDLVVVDIGSNDVTHLTSKAAFRSRYRKVLDRLPAAAAVVLLGVPDMGAPPRLSQPLRAVAGVRGGTLDAVVHDLARRRGHGYVDIAGATGPAFRSSPGRLFAADGYHPDDAGYALWADATVPVVEEAARAR